MAVGKNITNVPYNIEAVGKYIKWRKGEGDENIGGENPDLKMGLGKNIKL